MADSSFFLESGVFYPFDSSSGNIGGGGTLGNVAIWTGSNLLGSVPINGANGLVQLTAASKLPAIDGSLLTNLTSGALSGDLPAISGSALTAIPALTGEVTTSALVATITKSITPTWTGLHTFNNGVVMTPTLFQGGFRTAHTLTGATTGINYLNSIDVLTDTAHGGTAQIDLAILHSFGGAAMTGPRVALQNLLVQTATTGNTSVPEYYASGVDVMQSNTATGDGGTNVAQLGAFFGRNIISLVCGSNVWQNCGLEIDVGNLSASTGQLYQMALSLVNCAAVSAANEAAIYIYSATQPSNSNGGVTKGPWGPGIGWKNGILFAELGSNTPPLTSAATVLGVQLVNLTSVSVTHGVDFSKLVISGKAWQSPGASIDGSGIATFALYKVGINQVVGARASGYTAMTGTANKAATYDTSSVTLAQLAGRVMQLQADLTTHGLIGA